jgi:methylenetetrahydrofolate dehydrogenase (NADP+)/methenyltetrahydrofolate cyclohydrolase
MGTLINGKSIAERILNQTQRKTILLKKRGTHPKLGVILIGNDQSSEMYVKKKGEAAKRIGVDFELYRFPITISLPNIIKKIKNLQATKKLTGLIIQLPVPERLYVTELFNSIDPEIDVDCLTDTNLGKLIMNTQSIQPPTAGAVMEILKNLSINLVGKNVCLVGMGILVGKPLANLLINARASITTCNSATKNITQKCLDADIIVSGVGKANLIKEKMVKKGAIVIDTGISFIHNKVVGDVALESVVNKARYTTPTPGGVGPITVALLLYNTVLCAEKKLKIKN